MVLGLRSSSSRMSTLLLLGFEEGIRLLYGGVLLKR